MHSALTTSLFTTSLSLLKSTGIAFSLIISILSTSAFKLAKSDFAAKLDVLRFIAFLKPIFCHIIRQIKGNFWIYIRPFIQFRKILPHSI